MRVTAIMPTADRLDYLLLAIKYWKAQTWPDIELVIIDSGQWPITSSAAIVDSIRKDRRIRWSRGDVGMLVGDARNEACHMARGDVICHWDDDDWYGPNRITEQVVALQATKKPIVGSPSLIFADDERRRAWRYRYPGADYAVGVSLMYRKEAWADSGGFWHAQDASGPWEFGEDSNWLAEMRDRGGVEQVETQSIVARIHRNNTVRKDGEKLSGEHWTEVLWGEVESMGYEVAN